jgi:hypothetical protein
MAEILSAVFRENSWGKVTISIGSGGRSFLRPRQIFRNFLSDLIRGSQASPIVQLIRQLAEPKPGDLEQIDLSQYNGLKPPFDSWDYIANICEEISVELGDRL